MPGVWAFDVVLSCLYEKIIQHVFGDTFQKTRIYISHLLRSFHNSSFRLFVRFSPDDKILAVASADQVLDFYQLNLQNELNRVGYCKQLPSYVFQVDFSKDGKYIQVKLRLQAFIHVLVCI